MAYKKEVYDFDVSENFLKNVIKVFISGNKFVNSKIKGKIETFFEMLDASKFDVEKNFLLTVVKVIIKYRLKQNNTVDDILSLFSNAKNNDRVTNLFKELQQVELSVNDLVDIDRFISDRITFAFMYLQNPKMVDIVTRFETREFASLPSMIDEYKKHIYDMQAKFKEISRRSVINDGFILDKDHIQDIIEDVHSDLSAPSAIVQTGIKYLNTLLGGGFQSKRLYCFLSTPGNWKSGLLLNTALWALKYNSFKAKDPTKKPIIVYITVENSLAETVERTFNHYDSDDFVETETSKIVKLISEEMIRDDLAFAMNYMIPLKTSTADIEELLDDYRYNGYEPVMVVVDYLRRLKLSTDDKSQDNYINIGNIATELSTLAKTQNIVVVTASQLNRDAEKKIETAQASKQTDFISLLGRSEISESRRILEEIDEGYVIFPVYNSLDNKTYLAFKNIKKRGKKKPGNEQLIFYVPFKNGMALQEDMHTEKTSHIFDIQGTMQSGNVRRTSGGVTTSKINVSAIDKAFADLQQQQIDENDEFDN